jgi:hypothetical protein
MAKATAQRGQRVERAACRGQRVEVQRGQRVERAAYRGQRVEAQRAACREGSPERAAQKGQRVERAAQRGSVYIGREVVCAGTYTGGQIGEARGRGVC